ncbi:MAG TPA: histidine phosphatase family protein [Allosphingosinicella sp.]|nr:histidine phosphatase family protein [Allosphingosinicella sp.]
MKILTLLRHAKSGWDDPVLRDFDRPLSARGREAARRIGIEMKAQGLAFDLVLASPARRVVETLDEVATGYGGLQPRYDERLYLAAAEALFDLVRHTPDSIERLLLVGHNPGLEELALRLSRRSEGELRGRVETHYPTGTVAEIELPADHWADLREGSGRVVRFIRPCDLDPELGPDGK